MIELMKEVGRGKRGARDLTYEEARKAAEQILTGKATPAQIGAFLMAERIKMEGVDELAAFIEVLRQYAIRDSLPAGIDCAGPYDGRRSTYMATFAAAFLLASAGLPVTLHGAASLPPKQGIVMHDMLASIGIKPHRAGTERAALIARETGVLYAHADIWCPPLAQLRPIREQLGMRTLFNTAEKLIDYAHSPYLVVGVYHNTVFERLSQLLSRLAYRKALIVQGVEGSEDLFIDRPTRVLFVDNGETRLLVLDPKQYGLDSPKIPVCEWTPADQLRITEEVLQDTAECPAAFRNQTLLNGALRMQLSGQVKTLQDGIVIGKQLLSSGNAWQVYTKWKEAWQLASQSS